MASHSVFFVFFLFFFVALFYVGCALFFLYKEYTTKLLGGVILISSTIISFHVAKVNKLQNNCLSQARDGICAVDTRKWELWENKIIPDFYDT